MQINWTFVGQAIEFIIFVWLCMKFIWPPIISAIEARQKDIADGLEAAEKGKRSLELATNNAKEQIKQTFNKSDINTSLNITPSPSNEGYYSYEIFIAGEDYFDNGISIIEWGEIIEDILPKGYIKVTFSKDDGNDTDIPSFFRNRNV